MVNAGVVKQQTKRKQHERKEKGQKARAELWIATKSKGRKGTKTDYNNKKTRKPPREQK